ncbi:proline-rich receptor-like protein kinase PERK9 [Homalodisca vitripennis]|uniref:proline-rich receptor-like protein kinase PERK9 n=1 Tax=Homalodisca vitripennis TaxID=197043 RepID=UPI001EECAD71|nr:proline-rich receptor-like protein kinase PERK9 [Homalodisca vitripennis]XP_046675589.1 proline-rich receptor-like protein kinase PERK9 [Homalodisca vitripennis]XP_046675590.1 proline-rich receptor-like protein kinase PERK9 [Homalodisca vitripennis]
MTKDNLGDIEIRKLPAGSLFKLCSILDCGDDWKQLMSVIPVACKEGNPPKYTVEHMKLIETAGMCQKRPYSEILLEEWGTSGKCRPTVSVLLQCLLKAELYRAADFVAVQLLKGPPPRRPESGPAAAVVYPEEPASRKDLTVASVDNIPSAPPLPSDIVTVTPPPPSTPPHLSVTPQFPSPPRAATPQNPTVLVEPDTGDVERVSYSILESATENFTESRILGGGAYGSVYQACLPRLGAVAVKRFHPNDVLGNPQQQFCNEVQVLAQLSHPNLLPLLAYSDDGPALCLAYKYMRHGSLLDQLASQVSLAWRTRVEIAKGTARGICHLHLALQKPLVHRDVKSANILLDNNFTAKLGDFGLVKLGGSGSNSRSVIMTTTVIGTSAYMAPEAHRGDVSVKMDIFSFGVVLLELLTGLPPYDGTREGHDLITHVEDSDDREAMVDDKAGNWPPEVVTKMFELVDLCLLEKRKRPNILQVIEKLDSLLA